MEVSMIIMVKRKSHMPSHMVTTSDLTRFIAKINNLNMSNLNKVMMVLECNTINLNKVFLWKWLKTQHNRPI